MEQRSALNPPTPTPDRVVAAGGLGWGRWRQLIVALVAVCSLLLLPIVASAATTSDFTGLWHGVDPTDDSDQLLLITRTFGGDLRIWAHDDFASGCGSGQSVALGRGEIEDDTLTADIYVICLNGSGVIPAEYLLTYDEGQDTLTDNFGATFVPVRR